MNSYYFPQDLLFNCEKYDELRKTLFHKIKSLLCPNVNLNSFKNSYCGLLYKIVVSIGNAKITSSWNMI
jgi:hypothetical protein